MDYVNFLHGGNIEEVEKKYRRKIIDFSANINPLGLPPAIKKAICKNLDKILHYPDFKAEKVTQKIAKYWQIDKKNILLGNGSVEFIYLIASAYRPKTVLIPTPTFSEYERAAKSIGSKIQFLKLKEEENFKLDISDFDNSDILFLCNPNNPTGNLILTESRTIERMVNELLVVDEAFMDFLPQQKKFTLIYRAVKNKKIAALRSFTKFFALPGLRMGYIVAHKDVINKLRQHQPPWSTNSLAQAAAEVILSEGKYINKTYKFIEKERKFLSGQLTRIEGLKPYPTVTNFLLIKIEKSRLTSKSLRNALIKKGLLIRDCANFRSLNDKYIRVAVRSHEENLKLLTAIKGVL